MDELVGERVRVARALWYSSTAPTKSNDEKAEITSRDGLIIDLAAG